MFNNTALDVFIGLIVIYLLYSLLASILMEAVAKYLGLRQRNTLKAIYKLLDDSDYKEQGGFCRFIKSIEDNHYWHPLKYRPFTALFYAHPNIKNLGRNNFNRKPSSITPEMFTETLIQILRGDEFIGQQNQIDLIKSNLQMGKIDIETTDPTIELPLYYKISDYKPYDFTNSKAKINKQTYYQLQQFLNNSHSDIDWFKKNVINWFNEMMDRSEGWYIKQTRIILFLIGFLVAVVFNVDSIAISKRLASDKTARQNMIQFASNISSNPKYNGELKDLSDSALKEALRSTNSSIQEAQSILGPPLPSVNICYSILGWWITAFALSLGASFWFDLLGKIMCIRQGGNNSSTDAQKKVDKSLTNPTVEPIG